MKRSAVLAGMVFLILSNLSYASDVDTGNDEIPNSLFQIVLGPGLDLKDWGAKQTIFGIVVGDKNVRFGMSYSYEKIGDGINMVRPYIVVDYPFTYVTGEESQIDIGPIFDLGPEVGFTTGSKIVDVGVLGIGMDVKYYFNNNIGVSLTPIHFSNSFATYNSGGAGFVTKYRMSYDLLFSFIMRY